MWANGSSACRLWRGLACDSCLEFETTTPRHVMKLRARRGYSELLARLRHLLQVYRGWAQVRTGTVRVVGGKV